MNDARLSIWTLNSPYSFVIYTIHSPFHSNYYSNQFNLFSFTSQTMPKHPCYGNWYGNSLKNVFFSLRQNKRKKLTSFPKPHLHIVLIFSFCLLLLFFCHFLPNVTPCRTCPMGLRFHVTPQQAGNKRESKYELFCLTGFPCYTRFLLFSIHFV